MNAKPGNVSITGETTIPFTIAKAKQNITAETESESVHVNTEEPITVNGLGEDKYCIGKRGDCSSY